MGSKRGAVVSAEQLAAAATALAAAVEAGGEQLPAAERQRADAVVEKVTERTALVASVGVRRPTTSTPTAAIWGDEPAGDLLDWLGVGARHLLDADPGDDPRGGRRGAAVGSLDG